MALAPFDQQPFRDSFPGELLDYLVYTHVESHSPRLFGILRLLAVFDQPESDISRPLPYTPYRVNWSQLGKLVTTPGKVFEEAYGWGTQLFTEKHPRLLQALSDSLDAFDLPTQLVLPTPIELDSYYDPGSRYVSRTLKLFVPLYSRLSTDNDTIALVYLAASALPVPRSKNLDAVPEGVALYLYQKGSVTVRDILLADNVSLSLDGEFEGTGGFSVEIFQIRFMSGKQPLVKSMQKQWWSQIAISHSTHGFCLGAKPRPIFPCARRI